MQENNKVKTTTLNINQFIHPDLIRSSCDYIFRVILLNDKEDTNMNFIIDTMFDDANVNPNNSTQSNNVYYNFSTKNSIHMVLFQCVFDFINCKLNIDLYSNEKFKNIFSKFLYFLNNDKSYFHNNLDKFENAHNQILFTSMEIVKKVIDDNPILMTYFKLNEL